VFSLGHGGDILQDDPDDQCARQSGRRDGRRRRLELSSVLSTGTAPPSVPRRFGISFVSS
jgi:hypothetical protein